MRTTVPSVITSPAMAPVSSVVSGAASVVSVVVSAVVSVVDTAGVDGLPHAVKIDAVIAATIMMEVIFFIVLSPFLDL